MSSLPEKKSLRSVLGVAPKANQTSSSSTLLPKPISKSYPYIVGHRGCLYDELENTRKGFDECAKMGCQAVELDVFKLKCGTLVVFHGGGTDENPGDLLDYCGVPGSILDVKDYEEALSLRFNPLYDEFPCPKESIDQGSIPTLEQVLQDAKMTGIHVKIELKGEGTVQPTIELVERLGMTDQCSYSSFDLEKLKELRMLRSDTVKFPSGALFDDVPDDYLQQARDCGATEVHLRYDTCTKERVDEIHAAGFGSMLWMRGPVGMASDCRDKFSEDTGNEDPSMYETLLQTGVQQLCINKPKVLISWLEELKRGFSLVSTPYEY